MNKKGIELAMSLIVVLIVTIVILGLGGTLTYKIMCGASDKIDQADATQQKIIEQSLVSGAHVQIPDASKTASAPSTICGGSTVRGASFTLGIRNDDAGPADTTYTICYVDDGINGATAGGPCVSPDSDVQFRDSVTIGPRRSTAITVLVNVPSNVATGKHMYTMKVKNGAADYGAANFYLTVE